MLTALDFDKMFNIYLQTRNSGYFSNSTKLRLFSSESVKFCKSLCSKRHNVEDYRGQIKQTNKQTNKQTKSKLNFLSSIVETNVKY